jgi:hypothetical protein
MSFGFSTANREPTAARVTRHAARNAIARSALIFSTYVRGRPADSNGTPAAGFVI